MKRVYYGAGMALLLLIVLISAIASIDPTATWAQVITQRPQAGEPVVRTGQLTVEVPFFADWLASPHADVTAEAFIHWNLEDPPKSPCSAPAVTARRAIRTI
jgi:hypothetical protein